MNMRRLWFMGVMMLAVAAGVAHALTLTPAQIQQLQQLSPEQRKKFLQQFGGGRKTRKHIARPQVVKPRTPGTGPAEQEAKTVAKPAPEEKKAATPAPQALERVKTPSHAEVEEIRRAFAAFVEESKPLRVSTKGLKQFGYELFAGAPSTFAPATEIPVPPEYILGPGDEIRIQFFGKRSGEIAVTVDREGMIVIPDVGALAVAGMRFDEARALIAGEIKDKLIGVTARVVMGKLRSIRIFVLGEVARPGSYLVSGLATMSHALFVSGGVKKTGSLRRIQLKRQGKVVAELDLYDFLLHGDTRHDVRLLPQDVIFVPPLGPTAAIAGAVLRPAIYELKRERTLGALIQLAGGLRPRAYRGHAQIERYDAKDGKRVLDVPLTRKGLATRIRDGDVVKIFPKTEYEENAVFLLGNVKRPGKYAWHPGMTLREILPDEEALLPETFLDYALIEREEGRLREPAIYRFHLGEALAGRITVALKPHDKVFVFHRARFRRQPYARIQGAVAAPGSFALKKDMRISDLVLAAGGLARDAYTGWAELYRLDPETKETHRIVVALAEAMAGKPAANLLLEDRDRLVVHSIWEFKTRDTVEIRGEVHHPGVYPLAVGMRVSDLVLAAGSVTERAYLKNAEITRYEIVNGEKREARRLEIDLAKALAHDPEHDILLEPYDRLIVRRIENWRPAEIVHLKGEFRFPGDYPIEAGERLSSVIARAGGFTEDAYLPAAIFLRESIKKQQQRELVRMRAELQAAITRKETQLSGVSGAEAEKTRQALEAARRILAQLEALKATGRMVIRLADAEKLKGTPFDLRLQDGDTLIVPKRPDHVLVLGEVFSPNAQIYRPGKGWKFYVEHAGGFTRFADEDHIYVVHANGEVEPAGGWKSVRIGPGDAIVVPQELAPFNLLGAMLDWSKVFYQIGVTLASMRAIGII